MQKSQGCVRGKTEYAGDLLAALLMGFGSFMVFKTAFGLTGWFGGSLPGGLIKCWNDMADALGRSDFYLLDKLTGASDSAGTFLLILFLGSLVLAYLIARSGNPWLTLLYLVPLVFLTLATHLAVRASWALVLLAGVAWMALQKKYNGRAGLWNGIFTGALLVLAILLSAVPFVRAGLDQPAVSRTSGAAISEAVHHLRYGGGGSDVAMTVTMDNPESYYLRGFVGDKFTNGQWNDLSCGSYYDSVSLFHWLGEKGFSPYTQLAAADELVQAAQGEEAESPNAITVDVKGASAEYIYLPYEAEGTLPGGTKDWAGSHLTAAGLRGMRSYTFMAAPNITGRWTDLIALFTVPVNADIEAYNALESHSNVDIYQKYTYLSEEDIESLIAEIGTRGNQEKGHVNYKVAIGKVRAYMDEKVLYVDHPLERADRPFLEAFFTDHKGNDADCATAATLLFRYYGIPARYVEGYLVTLADKEAMSPGQPYDIPAENRHAWTEIYVDTIGWVPLEVCEPYYGVMAEADLEKGLESGTIPYDFDQLESRDGGAGSHHESEPEEKLTNYKPLLFLGAGLLILLLLILLALALRALAKYGGRQRAFRQSDTRAAVCAIYGYMQERELPAGREAQDKALEAAYSTHTITEADRTLLLQAMKDGKKLKRKEKRK